MKPPIKFRAMTPSDHEEFTRATSYYPGPQFGGVVAWCWDGQKNIIMGAVGLDGWTRNSVMAHWYIKHPRCIMPLWNEVTGYLARHGYRKVIGSTPGDNVRALRMIFNKLGFIEVTRLKDAWDDGVDIVISEYRIHAQQQQHAA